MSVHFESKLSSPEFFPKKRTNEFIFITMRHVFVRFSEEIEDTKTSFSNYLTFSLKTQVHFDVVILKKCK